MRSTAPMASAHGHVHHVLPKDSSRGAVLETTDDSAWVDLSCGHCGRQVSGAVVAFAIDGTATWVRCVSCGRPTAMWHLRSQQAPPAAAAVGEVEGLGDLIEGAWAEARACLLAGAPTAAEMMCRKILMQVAIDRGAAGGKKFASYVGYLEDEGVISADMRTWVDRIRGHGNAAAHELELSDADRARDTVSFTEMLLRVAYETRARMVAYGHDED